MSSPNRVILTLDNVHSQVHYRRMAAIAYRAAIVLLVLGYLSFSSRKSDKRVVTGIAIFIDYPRLFLEWLSNYQQRTSLQFFAYEVYNLSSTLLKQKFKLIDILLDNEIAFLVARGLVELSVDDMGVYLNLTESGSLLFRCH